MRYKPKSKIKLSEFSSQVGLNREASKAKQVLWYMIKIFLFLSPFPFPYSLKSFMLKLFGAKIGKGLVIKPRVNIHFPWKLEIGDNVWIGEEVFLLNFEKLTIGNNVCISQRAFLCGGNHDYKIPSMPYKNGPITLNDGCWVGAGSFIGPNVEVGVDSVIIAHSVISKSIPDNCIYGGNPASYIKNRW